jgi:hypothetical protein
MANQDHRVPQGKMANQDHRVPQGKMANKDLQATKAHQDLKDHYQAKEELIQQIFEFFQQP